MHGGGLAIGILQDVAVTAVQHTGLAMAQRRRMSPGSGTAAAAHGDDLAAERFHLEDVQALATHILFAHVDLTLEAKERRRGGAGHAMLPGTGLGDNARLAHAPRQKGLPDTVIDLMGTGMV